jgi:glycosyltransferase involved in cell wall biosynthesis
MDISIIICTYNRAALLDQTLKSLRQQNLPPHLQIELIVVDNASKDATRETVESWIGKIPFEVRYFYEAQQGKSFALNTGIEASKGNWVYFTDDDVILDPNWISEMHQATRQYPEAHGFGGRVIPEWPDNLPDWFGTEPPYRLSAVIPFTNMGNEVRAFRNDEATMGCNCAFSREIFDQGFRFRTDLGFVGKSQIAGEDTEFAFELMRQGYRILYTPNAVIYHPVIADRMTKTYVRNRYNTYGQGDVRAFGPTKYAHLPRFFGVYRYLFRETLQFFFQWIRHFLARNAKASFYYEVQLRSNFGAIRELLFKKPPAPESTFVRHIEKSKIPA